MTVEDGSARVVPLSRRRSRGEALFHLSGEPAALAELLAGERQKVGRLRRKARLTGNRKRAQELMALPAARLSLAGTRSGGARLEPALVYQALPFAIDPEWTRGHNFTVAQQIVELAPQAWHITVRDGRPMRSSRAKPGAQADATVTMSRGGVRPADASRAPGARRPSGRPRRPRGRRGAQALDRPPDLIRRRG